MQTFLPYPDFDESAQVLDYKRLGKQRVETFQLINAINGVNAKGEPAKGWVNHPAAVMWRGYEQALVVYGIAMCREWIRRQYNDTMLPRFEAMLDSSTPKPDLPSWLGRDEIHISHQSNLLRKDPEFYGLRFPGIPHDLPYVWPGES
jgi:hypothetical protein